MHTNRHTHTHTHNQGYTLRLQIVAPIKHKHELQCKHLPTHTHTHIFHSSIEPLLCSLSFSHSAKSCIGLFQGKHSLPKQKVSKCSAVLYILDLLFTTNVPFIIREPCINYSFSFHSLLPSICLLLIASPTICLAEVVFAHLNK